VAADLGFVAHTAKRHAHELAVRRPGDGFAQRGLADPGWAHQAQYRTLDLAHALLHREVLENALLDFLEAVVVGVENSLAFLRSCLTLLRLDQGTLTIQSM
jgi:hypothetical protein